MENAQKKKLIQTHAQEAIISRIYSKQPKMASSTDCEHSYMDDYDYSESW